MNSAILQVCLEKLSDYLDAVYDITIAYKEADDECALPRIQAPSMPGINCQWNFLLIPVVITCINLVNFVI